MNLKICLLLCALLGSSGCVKKSLWRPSVFMPQPERVGVERKGEFVKCSDTSFRMFACLPKKDLEKLHATCFE